MQIKTREKDLVKDKDNEVKVILTNRGRLALNILSIEKLNSSISFGSNDTAYLLVRHKLLTISYNQSRHKNENPK